MYRSSQRSIPVRLAVNNSTHIALRLADAQLAYRTILEISLVFFSRRLVCSLPCFVVVLVKHSFLAAWCYLIMLVIGNFSWNAWQRLCVFGLFLCIFWFRPGAVSLPLCHCWVLCLTRAPRRFAGICRVASVLFFDVLSVSLSHRRYVLQSRQIFHRVCIWLWSLCVYSPGLLLVSLCRISARISVICRRFFLGW